MRGVLSHTGVQQQYNIRLEAERPENNEGGPDERGSNLRSAVCQMNDDGYLARISDLPRQA